MRGCLFVFVCFCMFVCCLFFLDVCGVCVCIKKLTFHLRLEERISVCVFEKSLTIEETSSSSIIIIKSIFSYQLIEVKLALFANLKAKLKIELKSHKKRVKFVTIHSSSVCQDSEAGNRFVCVCMFLIV